MKKEIDGQPAELLFYNNWRYNVVRIENELKRIFENEGGEVVRQNGFQNDTRVVKTPTYVRNRALMDRIKELKRLTAHPENVASDYMPRFRSLLGDLERLQQIDNSPILKTGARNFVLNDMFYSLLFDDNVFFDTHYAVAHVSHVGNDRVIQYDSYRKFPDDWKYDCLYKCDCSADDIREIAYLIFNHLMKASPFPERGDSFYVHSIKE